ncbi:MAG: hypothetical protein GYA52_09190 [Chloroflexi bacterium]|nr:hypothetical protein [Chloroflexota bacterium]
MNNINNDREFSLKKALGNVSWVSVLAIGIIIAVLLSRFIGLGDRVMSHDEVNHVVPSYDFYSGLGYEHNPLSHGPFQFHLIALSYFLFGDNDFTSRLPHAIFSVATVIFVLFAFRKYFKKGGATISALLFLISPLLLFYGRYARNEAFVGLFLVVILYSVIRYFDKRDDFSLYLFAATLSLYYTSKETAYIHTAILMIFLFFKFIAEILHNRLVSYRTLLLNILLIGVIGASLAGSVLLFRNTDLSVIDNNALVLQNAEIQTLSSQFYFVGQILKIMLPGILPLLGGLFIIVLMRRSLHWDKLSASPAFNLFVLVTTLVLPLLSAFPVRFCGYDPIAYTSATSNMLDLVYILYLAFVSILLGFTWRPKQWWKFATLFYAIFFVFYTTFLTNMNGALTGIVGSLGYWLAQQDVNRGNQPLYYYALIQLPVYEFLAMLGSLLAVIFAVHHKRKAPRIPEQEETLVQPAPELTQPPEPEKPLFVNNTLSITGFLLFWGIASLVAFSIAGEKMPWLTVQIAVPFLLLAGKALGELVDSIPWRDRTIWENGLIILISISILLVSCHLLISVLGNAMPFQGKTQQQLQDTYRFLLQVLVLAGLLFLYRFAIKGWSKNGKLKVFTLAFFLILSVITTQSALRAAFDDYDYPTEYLVYAHAAPGPKEILDQVQEISERITGGLDLQVAYDNQALYPFWWYFRHYPNRISYLENPTRMLEDVPIILAGQENYSAIEPIIRNNYYAFEYYRLWWPNQDYFNLTLDRLVGILRSPDMRQALFNIWYNRDYSLYAEVTNNPSLELANWSPAAKMNMYIRKDIADQMWDFVSEEKLSRVPTGDLYNEITTIITPDQFIGGDGVLNQPRGIDIAPDGTIYVADSKDNQIKQFTTGGTLLNSWGTFGSTTDESAPGGTFYEPWDVAVAPDSSVYVADTWNHRIQKFTSGGTFISMWGYFAQGDSPQGYWGPRSLTTDADGNVYFSDTGNKRIVAFDKDGNFLAQFGSSGASYGQFNEPVGIALDENNHLYIADTWNHRVQVLVPDLELNTSTTLMSWDVDGWFGESTDNKPYIAVNAVGNVFVSDPEGSLILEYSSAGELLHVWDLRGVVDEEIVMPVDIEFSADGTMWVSDASNNMIYGYTLPAD